MYLFGYRCGGEAGTLGSGGGFNLGSDGVCTLGRDEGSFPQPWGGCGVGGRQCLDGTSQDLCNLEIGVEDRGTKRK